MKKLKNTLLLSLAGILVLGSMLAFTHAPQALATVKKTKNGYVYGNVKYQLVKKRISNGYFTLTEIDFHHVDGKFYLVRHVKGKKGEVGYLFSQVRIRDWKLYPIERPEFYWPCWQVASCQCDRPSRYAACSCTAGFGSCLKDLDGGWNDPFLQMYNL